MIDDLKPYFDYKQSGVEWLGSVPTHWSVAPGKACFEEIYRPNKGMVESEVLSLSFGRIVIKPKDKLHGLVPESFETYQVIEPGDIVVRPTDLQNDWNTLRTAISPHRGIITSAYIALHTRGKLTAEFGDRLLRTYDLMKVFYGLGCGLRQNLSWADFKYLPCVLPPPDEQSAIVRFLDHANGKIERAIRAKRKLIGLLNEQKQAIIHRAVTCGLDPNVKLKPSGIPWLGDVPGHWEVRRVKQVTKILRGKFTHRPRNDPSLYGGLYPFIQTGAVARAKKFITEYKQTLNERGMAVSKLFPRGTLCMTIAANIGDVAILDFEACFPDSVVGFVPKSVIDRDFLYLVFKLMKEEFLRDAPVNTQGNLNVERIGVKGIPLPPPEEQHHIVAFVEKETKPFEAASARTEREIDLLREYRTTLTAEVVTGKLDVRDAAKRLPEQADEPLPLDDSVEDLVDDEIAEEIEA